VWYSAGLRFQCQPDCGACCTDHDDCTVVYLSGGDAQHLARHLGCSDEEFRSRYSELDDGDPVLKMDGPDCPFLDGPRCTVYPARPVQCRTFPFWRENLASRARWKRLGCFCPGIDVGERHDSESIREHLAARESDG
jgi:Fe-S-cluster containining protein